MAGISEHSEGPKRIPVTSGRKAMGIIGNLDQEWARVLDILRAEVGEAAFRSWLQPLSVISIDSGEVSLAVPTRFMRDWIIKNYADRIQSIWASENDAVSGIELVVVPGMSMDSCVQDIAPPTASSDEIEPAPVRAAPRKSAAQAPVAEPIEMVDNIDTSGLDPRCMSEIGRSNVFFLLLRYLEARRIFWLVFRSTGKDRSAFR